MATLLEILIGIVNSFVMNCWLLRGDDEESGQWSDRDNP